MNEQDFEQIATEEFAQVPARFSAHLRNIALLVEDEPDAATRTRENLAENETLLGLYHGVPLSVRGNEYGIGGTLPDTITLYRKPILTQAHELMLSGVEHALPAAIRRAVRETLWHEIGHAFGLDEEAVEAREAKGTNHYPGDCAAPEIPIVAPDAHSP